MEALSFAPRSALQITEQKCGHCQASTLASSTSASKTSRFSRRNSEAGKNTIDGRSGISGRRRSRRRKTRRKQRRKRRRRRRRKNRRSRRSRRRKRISRTSGPSSASTGRRRLPKRRNFDKATNPGRGNSGRATRRATIFRFKLLPRGAQNEVCGILARGSRASHRRAGWRCHVCTLLRTSPVSEVGRNIGRRRRRRRRRGPEDFIKSHADLSRAKPAYVPDDFSADPVVVEPPESLLQTFHGSRVMPLGSIRTLVINDALQLEAWQVRPQDLEFQVNSARRTWLAQWSRRPLEVHCQHFRRATNPPLFQMLRPAAALLTLNRGSAGQNDRSRETHVELRGGHGCRRLLSRHRQNQDRGRFELRRAEPATDFTAAPPFQHPAKDMFHHGRRRKMRRWHASDGPVNAPVLF